MYRPIFTIPVFIATAILVLHSALYRGRRSTLIFWGLGYVVAFCRELVYQNFFPTYRFIGVDLQLFHVPLTVPAGWLFEAYIGLYLAQWFMGTDRSTVLAGDGALGPREYGRRVLPVITLAAALTATISCAIENVAVRMSWWQSHAGGRSISPGWIPGHMFTVFWLLTLLVYLTHPRLRLRRNLAYVALALGFVTVAELIQPILAASETRPWIGLLAGAVLVGYLASVLLWARLIAFFGVFALCVLAGDFLEPPAIALGVPELHQVAWLCSVLALTLGYAAYVARRQGPEHPVRPADLL